MKILLTMILDIDPIVYQDELSILKKLAGAETNVGVIIDQFPGDAQRCKILSAEQIDSEPNVQAEGRMKRT